MVVKKKRIDRKQVEDLFELIITDFKNLCYKTNHGAFLITKTKIGTIRYLLSVRLDALLGNDNGGKSEQ